MASERDEQKALRRLLGGFFVPGIGRIVVTDDFTWTVVTDLLPKHYRASRFLGVGLVRRRMDWPADPPPLWVAEYICFDCQLDGYKHCPKRHGEAGPCKSPTPEATK